MKQVMNFIKSEEGWLVIIASTILVTLLCWMGGAVGTLLAIGVLGHADVGRFTEDALGLQDAEANSPELIRRYINRTIKEQSPTSTPLDTVFRHISQESGDKGAMNGRGERSMEYEYYAIDTKPVESELTTAYTLVTGASQATLAVDNPKIFSRRDTILVRGVSGYEVGTTTLSNRPLMLWVQDKTSDGKLVVRALNGKHISDGVMEVPAIALDKKLFRMGRAHNEFEVQTTPFGAWPNKYRNYCQIFKCQVEASTMFQLQSTEVNWTPSLNERLAIQDMRMTTEASFLFGEKSRFMAPYSSDADKEGYVYTTGGIVQNIKKTIDYDSSVGITEAFFSRALKNIFTGNGGSPTRVAFMGSGFTERVNNITSVQRQLGAKDHAVAWGIKWDEISSPFGTLLCKRHEVLDMYGWEDLCIVLDIENVSKVTYSGLECMVLDLKKSGQSNVDAAVLTEVAGTELYYPSTHAILKPATFSLL